ncbi:MAG: substrate-binding domain-containing protein [Chloroflexi bacterium]|nr:substrate-binding domain-containing protein [Chloroflexota bacterium]
MVMNRTKSRGVALAALFVVFVLVLAACGGGEDEAAPLETAPAEATPTEEEAPAEEPAETEAADTDAGADETAASEPDPALLQKALGTTDTSLIPEIILEAVARAGEVFEGDRLELALKCWKENTCDTGTGGELTVALADGFGENVWREVTHMEFVLQALTYPEIGKIIYTSAQGDTQKAISDFRSLIAQDVDVIATFADAADALRPVAREAMDQGILVVPYISGYGGEPGTDYVTFVAEDLCQLGKNFATVLNEELGGQGNVVFLGGTPGNPLSKAWQECEEPELADAIEIIGPADTNWTRDGTLQAMSGFLSQYDQIDGISYEYADGFLGGIRAYEAAGRPLDVVLTLRTDEVGLFCEWKKIGNPNFKIFFSSGGGFDPRIALTAAMTKLAGGEVPGNLVVPAQLQQVDESTCNESIPGEAPASTLVPDNVLAAMYPS